MILLLFAAVLSYAAGTPVFTPGGYHLGWVFAMFYFLCNNNGIEDKLWL
jgi:hypothetical protein